MCEYWLVTWQIDSRGRDVQVVTEAVDEHPCKLLADWKAKREDDGPTLALLFAMPIDADQFNRLDNA
jgi:hypothetical protein